MPTTKLRYTSRTAAQIREDLIKAIPSLAPSWTSHGEDEPGIALVDMLAGVADGLHYYFDKQALETFLPSVRLRKNAVNLSHLVGYRPRRAYAAQGTVQVYPQTPLVYEVYIPKHTQLTTQGGVPLVTLEDTYLPEAFSGIKTVRVAQGELRTTTSTSPGGSRVTVAVPTLDPSEQAFTVWTYDREWTEFRDSQPEDADNRWYHYHEDHDGNVTVRFVRELGNVPMAGTPIKVEYLVSQDATIAGATPVRTPALFAPENLTSAQLALYQQAVDSLTIVTGVINNYRPKERVSTLRYSAPLSIKTKHRAVSEIDYRFLARQIGGVKDVKGALSSFYTRQVVMYVLMEDGSTADADLLAQVRDYLNARNDLTLDVAIAPAPLHGFHCSVQVQPAPGYTEAAAIYRVREELNQFFRTTAFNFGRTIRVGEVYSIANRVDSVSYVNVTALYWDGESSTVTDLIPNEPIDVPWIGTRLVVNPILP